MKMMNILILVPVLIFGSLSIVFAEDLTEFYAHMDKGGEYFNNGQVQEALKEFEAADSMNPTNPAPKLNMGQIYWQSIGDVDKAISLFEQTKQIKPEDYFAYYYLAQIYFSKNEMDRAIKNYIEAKKFGLPINGDPFAEHLEQFLPRDIDLSYTSVWGKSYQVDIHGNPAGDNVLISDVLIAIEKMKYIFYGQDTVPNQINIEYVANKENGEVWVEKWTANPGALDKVIWVAYDTTPRPDFPSKIAIFISDSPWNDESLKELVQ